ncbi:MAG: hypothetical protein OHK93_004435 [Ramalina farinacea]|uniref:Uncharacterized protein n=1 Tax=Ramalina farinacea TaxID=258253 RepID=A0AA43QXB5_9LECA|nr:hypothetical protein [Ramalina farinacea]
MRKKAKEVPQPRRSIFDGDSSSSGNHSDQSTDSSRITTAKITKNDQAAATAPSPRTPDKALEKRSIQAASSGAAVLRERGAAKRVKTADEKSPQRKVEVFGRAYFGGKSLLGKDDVVYQKVLEQSGQGEMRQADDSSVNE